MGAVSIPGSDKVFQAVFFLSVHILRVLVQFSGFAPCIVLSVKDVGASVSVCFLLSSSWHTSVCSRSNTSSANCKLAPILAGSFSWLRTNPFVGTDRVSALVCRIQLYESICEIDDTYVTQVSLHASCYAQAMLGPAPYMLGGMLTLGSRQLPLAFTPAACFALSNSLPGFLTLPPCCPAPCASLITSSCSTLSPSPSASRDALAMLCPALTL